MIEPSQELQRAIEAAKAGGKVALEYYETQLEVKKKKDNSLVTIADIETEKVIKKAILKHYPEAKFLAEESGRDTDEDDFWIIDPIDGSRLFIYGVPQWSILIARYKKGEVTLGVVYVPTQNMLLYAEKGKGAYLNDKKISVSSTNTIKYSLGSFGSIRHYKNINPILQLNAKESALRGYEHAYALSLLAKGSMDLVIDSYGTPWDYAPFVRIIPEAGGKITDFEGEEWNLETKNLVATNEILHDEVIKTINKK